MTFPDLVEVTACASLSGIMEQAARDAYPAEACGLLVGWWEPGRLYVADLVVSDNLAENPLTGFEVDVGLQARLQRDLRSGDTMLVGVWHSHPSGSAAPSDVDSLAAFDPDFIWMITAVSDGKALLTSAHLAPTQQGGDFREVDFRWADDLPEPAS